ncbi:hypothetical protein [Pantoea agglomerans]|uniref:hypothetical protein n=1 Tax=Enterobacter agglomerans TaxID=549 RepID=UPI00117C9C76|nr:hypothetical protein [Pantoea agglomerans]NKE95250.1 hypothetical protein [Pantoea agglomerans]TRO76789.1 hypothetical protein E5140_01325 [Pantoea agglomerans]
MKKLTAEKCSQLLVSLKSNGMSILEGYYAEALEIALPILEQQERGDSGWIEWGGGKCPVDDNANVEVKFRDGCFGGSIRMAGGYYWGRSNAAYDSDIIAYRIIPERPTNQNGEQ